MPEPIEVRKIANKAEFKAFFEFPWTLYKDDPNWVPPLLSIRRDLLDKEKNPAWEYMEGDYFAAWRGEEIVGTIVALINHRHNEFNNEHIGFFGLFETYNDQQIANALLETAATWVKERGYDAIRGPQNFTTHEECGLLIDNFSPPVILMPYNPPYYQTLIKNADFEKAMDIVSIYSDRQTLTDGNAIERFEKIVSRSAKRSNITVRKIDMKRRDEEFRLFKDIYNAAWDKNWGFVPMTEKELDTLVESLGTFFEPELAFFAEVDGEPAGFNLSIPNLNEAVHRAYPRPGEPELWTMAKAGWHWKIRPIIKGIRTPLMGVKHEFRDKGVDLMLHYTLLKAVMPTRYQYVDSGWILETNELVQIALKMGSKIYKTHRFYEKRF